MSRRRCDGEGRSARCERQRQQQLVGKMNFDGRTRGMMLKEGGDRCVGNRLGWLSGATKSREAGRQLLIFREEKNAGAGGCPAPRLDVHGDAKAAK